MNLLKTIICTVLLLVLLAYSEETETYCCLCEDSGVQFVCYGPVPCNCSAPGMKVPNGLAGYCQSNCETINVTSEDKCRSVARDETGNKKSRSWNYMIFPKQHFAGAGGPDLILV